MTKLETRMQELAKTARAAVDELKAPAAALEQALARHTFSASR